MFSRFLETTGSRAAAKKKYFDILRRTYQETGVYLANVLEEKMAILLADKIRMFPAIRAYILREGLLRRPNEMDNPYQAEIARFKRTFALRIGHLNPRVIFMAMRLVDSDDELLHNLPEIEPGNALRFALSFRAGNDKLFSVEREYSPPRRDGIAPSPLFVFKRYSSQGRRVFPTGEELVTSLSSPDILEQFGELILIKLRRLRLGPTDDTFVIFDAYKPPYFSLNWQALLPDDDRTETQKFIDTRTWNVPTYTIEADAFFDPIAYDEVRDRSQAYFIQENVRDGRIHRVYEPESLYRWFGEGGRVKSPMTDRVVRLPFLRLPEYLR
ncbi:hypothetical protein KFL_007780090 [Klebsormidium nitens]|uniref:Uncharacterized protein n=1 Tax=Klebsormidium nitens TaxID=105231 RepID=A0A1Y1IMP1_KLENI|nr:hypothetical protein KFL_007780090 [Klebsormidium nitens]|eukprot:GAQ91402.1 hypothetical protein KFL_007780090 [Klebsormidium nitens]